MQSTRYTSQILMELEISRRISKNTQISNFMQIRPMGAAMFHVFRQTDRHNGANNRLSQFCERA